MPPSDSKYRTIVADPPWKITQRLGWDTWDDETLNHVEMAV